LQIREFAALTGVSVRTLHYYDEIGLLPPANVDAVTGYRFYDEHSLLRMQEILFYRELDFPLKTIAELLSAPAYNREKALLEQKKLLNLKKERLERLIAAVDQAMKGDIRMDAFSNKEFEQYKAEVREKWGRTSAYAEYEEKTKNASPSQRQSAFEGMEGIFSEFARLLKEGHVPASSQAQEMVKTLQSFITQHFYACTPEILSGLGQMYVCDERFQKNIDQAGEGTARFVSDAIAVFAQTALSR